MNSFLSILLVLSMLFMSNVGLAQTKAVDGIYKKYSKVKGVESYKASKLMMLTARSISDDFPKEVKSIRSISIDDINTISKDISDALRESVEDIISAESCQMVGRYDDKGHTVTLYSQSNSQDGKFKDLLLYIVGGKVISISEFAGEFDRDSYFIRQILEGKSKQ